MRAIFMCLACVAIPTHERGLVRDRVFLVSVPSTDWRSFHARRETVAWIVRCLERMCMHLFKFLCRENACILESHKIPSLNRDHASVAIPSTTPNAAGKHAPHALHDESWVAAGSSRRG
jgi:hypothetical protein